MSATNSYISPYTLGFAAITAAAFINLATVDHNLIPSRNYALPQSLVGLNQWENQQRGTIVSWSLDDTGLMGKLEVIQKFASGLLDKSKDLNPEIVQMVNDKFWNLLA
jgi:hypothetical protein